MKRQELEVCIMYVNPQDYESHHYENFQQNLRTVIQTNLNSSYEILNLLFIIFHKSCYFFISLQNSPEINLEKNKNFSLSK